MIGLFLAPALVVLASVSSAPVASQSQPAATPTRLSDFTFQSGSEERDNICYKMRTYIFERNDGDAPRLVRETTCPPAKPKLNRSRLPKARMIPAD
jgi:hypothetical protein